MTQFIAAILVLSFAACSKIDPQIRRLSGEREHAPSQLGSLYAGKATMTGPSVKVSGAIQFRDRFQAFGTHVSIQGKLR